MLFSERKMFAFEEIIILFPNWKNSKQLDRTQNVDMKNEVIYKILSI